MKVGPIFVDLSKAFNMLNHKILLAKLKVYGLRPTALKQMGSYLTGRFQSININSEIIAKIPQGPMLFNTLLNDLFLYSEEISSSNYADDNTLYSIGNTMKKLSKQLATSLELLKTRFTENLMVLNGKKSHH